MFGRRKRQAIATDTSGKEHLVKGHYVTLSTVLPKNQKHGIPIPTVDNTLLQPDQIVSFHEGPDAE